MAKQKTEPPDTIAGIPRLISLQEFILLSGLSRDTVNRRAGREVPPLVDAGAGKKGIRIDYARAYVEGDKPWLKAS